jgi:hypothetical protein
MGGNDAMSPHADGIVPMIGPIVTGDDAVFRLEAASIRV